MPSIGNIVIADTVPTNHTFSPVTTDGSLAKLANRAASIPSGFDTLSVEVTQPASATAAYRVKVKLVFPTVATVDGQDVVVSTNSFDGVINYSQLSSSLNRKNILKKISNLLAHATMVTVVENLEPIY